MLNKVKSRILSKKNSFLLIILFLILFLSACSSNDNKYKPKGSGIDPHKPYAWGQRQTIYVFAEDSVWVRAETKLRESIELTQFTTENETYFTLKRADFKNIDEFYKFNNLIFFCNLKSHWKESEYVKKAISKNVIQDVKANHVGLYPSDNLWANDQYVLFLIGDTQKNLLKLNRFQSDKIFKLFQEKLLARISLKTYGMDIYSAASFVSYPWKMKIPKNYIVYKKGKNFVSFIKRYYEKPDRYVAVYSEDMSQDNVNEEWIRKKRKEVFWDYYDEDFFKKDDVSTEKIDFLEWKGYKFFGRWQNLKYAVGGAFQTFAFYDKTTKKAFMIDNSVYFPQGHKLPALLELEAISRTFEVKNEKSN